MNSFVHRVKRVLTLLSLLVALWSGVSFAQDPSEPAADVSDRPRLFSGGLFRVRPSPGRGLRPALEGVLLQACQRAQAPKRPGHPFLNHLP